MPQPHTDHGVALDQWPGFQLSTGDSRKAQFGFSDMHYIWALEIPRDWVVGGSLADWGPLWTLSLAEPSQSDPSPAGPATKHLSQGSEQKLQETVERSPPHLPAA